jgi:hypothetical protein
MSESGDFEIGFIICRLARLLLFDAPLIAFFAL